MKPRRWSTLQRYFAAVTPSAIVLVFAALTFAMTVREQTSQLRADHSDSVIRTLDIALARFADAEAGQRGFLLTGNEHHLERFRAAEGDVRAYLATLDTLTRRDASQRARLDTLARLARARFAELERIVEARRDSGLDAVLPVVESDPGRRAMEHTRRVAEEMKGAERGLLSARVQRELRYSRLTRWILVVGSLIAVAAALLSNLLLARVARAREAAARELDEHNSRLLEQSLELEARNRRLNEQAVEMELQQQHLQEQASEMEAQTRELAEANAELAASAEERRLAEERLRLAIAAGRLGSWEWDIDSGRVFWSADVERMHGLDPGTFPGTFDAYQRDIHPEDRERVMAAIGASVSGAQRHEMVYRIVRPDGEVRWLEAHGQLLANGSGRPTKLVGVCLDVTDRKCAEDELRDANAALTSAVREREAQRAAADSARAQAEAANEAKSEFLATMSHELRTPLNAIAGYVDILALEIRGPLTSDQRDDLERIRKNGRYLLALINDILNFARLEAGKVEFSASRLAVRDLVAGVEPLVSPQLAACGITYGCIPCDPELHVVADAERTQQILLNLLTNAIKFTDAGGSISIACGESGDVAWIRVTDTGRGIAPERLEQIFEPFVQVDRRLTHVSQQGVGLGLAISRDLARRMGGDLVAESMVGEGSTFTLSLPRAGAAQPTVARTEGSANSLAGEVQEADEVSR